MTKPNFQQMGQNDLRAYVLQYREDIEAFQAYADRLKQQPGITVTSMEQLEQLIRQKEGI